MGASDGVEQFMQLVFLWPSLWVCCYYYYCVCLHMCVQVLELGRKSRKGYKARTGVVENVRKTEVSSKTYFFFGG